MKRFFARPSVIKGFLQSKTSAQGTLSDLMNTYLKARSRDTWTSQDLRQRAASLSGGPATSNIKDKERMFWTTAGNL
jgi:hypothetical protein